MPIMMVMGSAGQRLCQDAPDRPLPVGGVWKAARYRGHVRAMCYLGPTAECQPQKPREGDRGSPRNAGVGDQLGPEWGQETCVQPSYRRPQALTPMGHHTQLCPSLHSLQGIAPQCKVILRNKNPEASQEPLPRELPA